MPLSAARHPHPNVGGTRGQRPGSAARAHAQIDRLLRRGAPQWRAIRLVDLAEVQRRHLRVVPAPVAAPPPARQTHGCRAGQRRLSPRPSVAAVPAPRPASANPAVSAALQPTAGSDRTGLEVGSPARHAQPLLRHPRAAGRCGRALLPALAQAESGAPSSMLQYLRRCV